MTEHAYGYGGFSVAWGEQPTTYYASLGPFRAACRQVYDHGGGWEYELRRFEPNYPLICRARFATLDAALRDASRELVRRYKDSRGFERGA